MLLGERSTISATLSRMNFRALSFNSFHGSRGEQPVRGFLPRRLGKEAEIQEVKEKLMKAIKEKAILEARLRGNP
jgi:hypothetical protein